MRVEIWQAVGLSCTLALAATIFTSETPAAAGTPGAEPAMAQPAASSAPSSHGNRSGRALQGEEAKVQPGPSATGTAAGGVPLLAPDAAPPATPTDSAEPDATDLPAAAGSAQTSPDSPSNNLESGSTSTDERSTSPIVANAGRVTKEGFALPAADKVSEGQAVAHFTLSNFYFRRWNLKLAEVELEVAIMYWPGFRIAHRDLCLVSLCRGHFLRALAELMMVVGLGEPIPLNDTERAALANRALMAHYKQGVEHARGKRWKDAVAEFQWALIYGPRDPSVHRSLAFAYANLGDFSNAEREYEATFSADPTDALTHADFAFFLSDRGDRRRARDQMEQAVTLAPSTAALHVDLGWMAEGRGDFATAGAEFRKAVQLSPQHAGLWAHLGKVMERCGRADDAIEAYYRSLKLDPQQPEVRSRLVELGGKLPS